MGGMSLVDGIVDLAAARSMAQIQMAVAVKVLKTANSQGDAALQLLQSAIENLQESIGNAAESLSSSLDTYA